MGVSIIGWAHSPFGRLDDMDLEALIARVSRDALRHAEVAARDVDGIWLGQLNGGFVPDIFCSSLVLQADPELRWCPATRVENACASGAAAVYAACDAIEAGRARLALVVGAEKMTAVSGAEVTASWAPSYVREEASRGLSFPGLFGELATGISAATGIVRPPWPALPRRTTPTASATWAHMRRIWALPSAIPDPSATRAMPAPCARRTVPSCPMVPRRWCWPIPRCWPGARRAVRFRSRVQVKRLSAHLPA
ncbi:beta-ketoacyl synthase N-terminal-like domain-containing protein [Zoogloea sp.]|uniref:thiolase family protein n=1 Tax=Zoogloea sp. TaxID=49181 RepID=UPI0025EB904D|nr:beta-ketoacyl synthase N-terminal-like domain-containing protein [Zoogloea sp.]